MLVPAAAHLGPALFILSIAPALLTVVVVVLVFGADDLCICLGISLMVSVCFSSPPVAPAGCAVLLAHRNLP